MEILIQREATRDEFTPGEMFINGEHFCWTLEDAIREIPGRPPVEWKIYGKTAIPVGKYKVVINWSGRFKRQMTHILNVRGFEGIRIHNGMTERNTEGCPLVNYERAKDKRLKDFNRSAMVDLEALVLKALTNKEQVILEIKDPIIENTPEV
jgi:hypothetical protein